MSYTGHLLYIDITQICGIGCSFCMYADSHRNGASMALSERARENMRALINDPAVKRISISGEGEPLNNIATFHEILGLSSGGKTFEFITSGFLPHDKLTAFYEQTNAILLAKGDTCNIRLSSDSYHIEKVRHKAHGFSVQYKLKQLPSSLTFSFRSVDTDKEFTRSYLLEQFASQGISARIAEMDQLHDDLVSGSETFGIEYKNHVHPRNLPDGSYLDFYGYIAAIEARYGKRFTLGSMNKTPACNGMDVTIKPNGAVHFSGAETVLLGNIHDKKLSWDELQSMLGKNPLLARLYGTPLVDLLRKIEDEPRAQAAISRANNPYWLIKELSLSPNLLKQLVA